MKELNSLLHKGLYFLKDYIETFDSEEPIINTFFNGNCTETQFKTLLFLQSDSYINQCFKQIAYIVGRAYEKFGVEKLPIRVDITNTSNLLLQPYVETELSTNEEDAYICFKQMIIPLLYGKYMHNAKTLRFLTDLRSIIGLGSTTVENIYYLVADLFTPQFYFPTEDTMQIFTYINADNLRSEPDKIMGKFTNTDTFRLVQLGSRLFAEFIKDGILYKQNNINISTDEGKLQILKIYSFAEPLQKKTTLLTEYQENRKGVKYVKTDE